VTKDDSRRLRDRLFTEDFTLRGAEALRGASDCLDWRGTSFDAASRSPPRLEEGPPLVAGGQRPAEAATRRPVGVYPETKHPPTSALGLPLEMR